MGRMGASTGFPALRYRLVSEDDVDRVNNADLLVIGDSRELKLLRAWRDKLPPCWRAISARWEMAGRREG
ncbi:cellulose synthase regulator protein [Chromobacterium violaceum]|uniref:Cyclic di-GMP-binding protein n=1 Tax=Chromobacterium violaceum TaxID=536 RepID=A0A3S4JY71_CHRVL|nr:cellulose synthase regulator protein [Chromobacterium violaceum]